MRNLRGLLLAALFTDASLYLTFGALPFRALELGAGPGRLGILPTLYAGAYMLAATWGGRLSDRVPRLTLARGGCVVFCAGSLLLSSATSLTTLFAWMPILGLGLGFFWSPVQAELSDRAAPVRLSQAVGWFNVAWSLGKGSGLLLGGIFVEAFDPSRALLIAAAPVVLTILVLPRGKAAPTVDPAPSPPLPPVQEPAPRRLLHLAWMTNAVAFGIASTVTVHSPKLLLAHGGGPTDFGLLAGTVFVTQTATFALLHRHHPGFRTLVFAQALGGIALLLLLAAPTAPLRIAAAVPLGLSLGLAYQASIHLSLNRAQGRGRAAGWHEGLLGAGSSSLPLVGGVLAAATDRLTAPFLLGAVALFGALVVTALRARGPSRPAG